MIDTIIKLVREGLSKVKNPRQENRTYTLSNLLNMGFAMFSLKDPSVSFFRDSYSIRAENLATVYGVEKLPGNIAFREALDQVNPLELQAQFSILIDFLRQQGVLKERKVLGEYIAVSVDATGHYCSSKKQCPQCLVKNHKSGKQTFLSSTKCLALIIRVKFENKIFSIVFYKKSLHTVCRASVAVATELFFRGK